MLTLRGSSFILFLSASSHLWAIVTPVAITGDTVPGLPGTQYASFANAQLNADGRGVYSATLQTGIGGISATNDKVLISFDGALSLYAQTGAENVAGATGKDFAAFQEFKIASTGDVLMKATLVEAGDVTGDNNQGYWRYSGGIGTLITRSGTSAVPGVSGAKFFSLGGRVSHVPSGDFGFLGLLETVNGVTPQDDFGIWQFSDSNGTLVIRENNAAPDVAGGLFNSFSRPGMNGSNQLTFRATMKSEGGVTTANRAGVWFYNNGTGQLIARANSAGVPGNTGDYATFEDPLINESGQVIVRATLASGERGLWLYTGTAGTSLALTNTVGVPDLPTATFTNIGSPLLTNSGRVVALGTLTSGIADVTTSNDSGLWMFDPANGDRLLAREGVGGVAGIAEASFASFEHIAPIDDTGIYVNATLQASPGIADASNDEGIWRIPFDGLPQLVLRKGDSLAGRIIADLWLPAGEFDDTPVEGISNTRGDLLFHASFTDGAAGLFVYSPSTVTEFADADFNEDGNVDGADLALWQAAYGTTAGGDANDDGDTDGTDFLTWQRQYTGSATLSEVQTVPEPSVSVLLTIGMIAAQIRIGRRL